MIVTVTGERATESQDFCMPGCPQVCPYGQRKAARNAPHLVSCSRPVTRLLAGQASPIVSDSLKLDTIRWNAQEDPVLASSLDVHDRVRVEFGTTTQDSRIVGIKHSIQGSTWMIQLSC